MSLNSNETPHSPGNLAPAVANQVAVAWAAGLYEGEGSCNRITGQVYVSQQDPWCLHRLVELFGGRVGGPYEAVRDRYGVRRQHVWYISGPAARSFLRAVFPFLSPRRQQQIRAGLGLWAFFYLPGSSWTLKAESGAGDR